jgi:hypothetical protein
LHDAQQTGLQQQVADLSRAVQGMHALLTTQSVGAGLGGGLTTKTLPLTLPNNSFLPSEHSATTKHKKTLLLTLFPTTVFCRLNTQQQLSTKKLCSSHFFQQQFSAV